MREIRGDLSLDDFEVILGLSRSSISLYERGSAWPKPDTLSNYAEYGKVSYEWILTGKDRAAEQGIPPSTIEKIKESSLTADTVQMHVYAMAGAGMPQTLSDYDPIETLNLPSRFAKPNISPIKIEGRSMEPMIVNGAIVGVDRDDLHVVSGEIYAVWLPYEGAVVKRLYMGANSIILKSDNPNFPEITIPVPEIGQDHLNPSAATLCRFDPGSGHHVKLNSYERKSPILISRSGSFLLFLGQRNISGLQAVNCF